MKKVRMSKVVPKIRQLVTIARELREGASFNITRHYPLQGTGATISPVNTRNSTIPVMERGSFSSQPLWWQTSRISGVSITWGSRCGNGWRLRRRGEEVRCDTWQDDSTPHCP
jgi:hypothetical protein